MNEGLAFPIQTAPLTRQRQDGDKLRTLPQLENHSVIPQISTMDKRRNG